MAMPTGIDRAPNPGRRGRWSRAHNRTKRNLAALLVTLAGILALAANCGAADPTLSAEARHALRLQPGVVLVYVSYDFTILDYQFKCSSSGSGFLYRPDGYMITNGHVVQLANRKDLQARAALSNAINQCIVDTIKGSRLTDEQRQDVVNQIKAAPATAFHGKDPEISVVLDNGSSYKGEIKAYSDPVSEGGKDVAVIKIDGRNLPTVPLGHSDGVSVGDEVTVIGYPGAANLLVSRESALIPTVTHGRISAVNKIMAKGTPVLQSEVTINHGNSGGPAFDDKGNAIGIATYGSQEASGFNFFVPIDTAWEFVRQAGADPASGPFDTVWTEALDAYSAQHWKKAHALIGSALELMPNQPDVMKLQRQAAANERSLGPGASILESLESPPILIGGGLILAAIVIVAIVFLKPSRAPVAGPAAPVESAGMRPTTVQTPPPMNLGALHITSGPLKGKQYPIPKTGLLIGRDPQKCIIVLPGDNVGREHAWVMPMENGRDVAVIDRGSANGTYLNSTDTERIKKALLQNGDRIFICRENSTEIAFYRP
ncbi:MAG: trypsin-like peptidase domain-containing protein [Acidobacteriia bacterium]|nr:trypsin-like peptidase domain-containing protein [Terriglobia bacterium]